MRRAQQQADRLTRGNFLASRDVCTNRLIAYRAALNKHRKSKLEANGVTSELGERSVERAASESREVGQGGATKTQPSTVDERGGGLISKTSYKNDFRRGSQRRLRSSWISFEV